MSQTFKLKNGEITFESNMVIIQDDSKKRIRLRLLSSGAWTMYGVLSVLRYLNTGDQFLLWTGLIIGIGHSVIFILALFRSNQNEISFDEIKSMKIGKRFNNRYLEINLKNSSFRRIVEIGNSGELEDYVKSNLGSFLEVEFK